MVQILEDAISHSIAMRKGHSLSLKQANEILEKHLSDPLGAVIKFAKKEKVFPEPIQQALESFKDERNWLVHKCVQIKEFVQFESNKTGVFRRIQAITENARVLQRSVEADLVEYLSSLGKDMSRVKAEIQKHYEEVE